MRPLPDSATAATGTSPPTTSGQADGPKQVTPPGVPEAFSTSTPLTMAATSRGTSRLVGCVT